VLTHVPGVSSSSFSPGASRPVLRGFSGDRVRVLVDGLGGERRVERVRRTMPSRSSR
jgi:hypothetical protein